MGPTGDGFNIERTSSVRRRTGSLRRRLFSVYPCFLTSARLTQERIENPNHSDLSLQCLHYYRRRSTMLSGWSWTETLRRSWVRLLVALCASGSYIARSHMMGRFKMGHDDAYIRRVIAQHIAFRGKA